MPRIDPQQLLKCLSVLLTPSGGIKTENDVARLVSLMTKFSKKLVSKCIYILILKTTEVDLLDMFMSAGGWDLLFTWLSDGINAKNWPLVIEVVELLLLVPVDISRLKENNCPKVIKNLSKDGTATEEVRQAACKVVESWLTIVKGACEGSVSNKMETEEVAENGSDEDKSAELDASGLPVYKITIRDGNEVLAEVISSDRTSSPIVETVEDENKVSVTERTDVTDAQETESSSEDEIRPVRRKLGKPTRKRSADPDFVPGKPGSGKKQIVEKRPKLDSKKKEPTKQSSSLKKEPKKDKSEKSKEIEKISDKDRDTLTKLASPSLITLGKIPKKKTEDRKPVEAPKPLPKDPKKYNISVEPRKNPEERPKTVKTFNSKFRSTGLEEAPPPPKSVKKKEDEEKKSTKRPSPSKEPHHSAEKKPKVEEKKHAPEEKKTEKPTSPHGPPAKSKIVFLQESDVFADALAAGNSSKDVRKKKRRTSVSSQNEKEKKETSHSTHTHTSSSTTSSSNTSSSSSSSKEKSEEKTEKKAEPVKPVFKFYQDTLVTSEDKTGEDKVKSEKVKVKDENKEEEEDCPSSPLTKAEIDDEVAQVEEAITKVLRQEEIKNEEREKNRLPRGILVYVKKRKTIKKKVIWRADNEIEEVQYFELDETERVNVSRNFSSMRAMERTSEREFLMSRKLSADDVMEEKTPWRKLITIDIPGNIIVPGCNSVEKNVQFARERTTLQAIYFNKKMIPDSPAEPDLEIHAHMEPTVIPLEDQTGTPDSVISYKGKSWPEPKGYPPGIVDPGIEVPTQNLNQILPPPGAGAGGMGFQGPPMMGPFPGGPPNPFPGPPFGQPHHGPMGPGGPEWMGNDQGMMGGMGGPPGMMGPPGPGPEMFGMGPPGPLGPPHEFMGGPPGPPHFMGPPMGPPGNMGGMFPPFHHGGSGGGPPSGGPQGHPQDMRPPRPWFRNQGPPNNSWRHPKGKGNWRSRNMGNNFTKKGPYRHPTPNNSR